MKIDAIKTINREDLAKYGDLPPWIDPMLGTLNSFIQQIGRAIQNGIDFENNFFCKIKKLKFTSGTELIVNPDSKSKVRGVIVLSNEGLGIAAVKWVDKTNGNIGVTITFSSGSTANCEILILLR